MDEDRKKELLMKAVDGLASEEELAELKQAAGSDPALADEFRAFTKIKEVTDSIMFKDLPDSHWEGYWTNVYNRLERGIGWVLMSIGAIILLCYGAYQLFEGIFTSPEVSLVIKIGVAVGGAGLIILLISIVREVIFARKKERYKEVKL